MWIITTGNEREKKNICGDKSNMKIQLSNTLKVLSIEYLVLLKNTSNMKLILFFLKKKGQKSNLWFTKVKSNLNTDSAHTPWLTKASSLVDLVNQFLHHIYLQTHSATALLCLSMSSIKKRCLAFWGLFFSLRLSSK